MSVSYKAIGWDAQKRAYDAVLAGSVVLTLAAFFGVNAAVHPNATAETSLIRATGLTAILLLHVILAIGPLARLDRRFLLLHYNRRHLGVTMFFLAAVHGLLATVQFHALGNEFPLISVFTAYAPDYLPIGGAGHLPFEAFGVIALAILFLMAATSHDFWLRNLSPGFWKGLHQAVYVAYGCLQLHVFYGVVQSEGSLAIPIAMGTGALTLLGLHLASARMDAGATSASRDTREGYVEVCAVEDLAESKGRVVEAAGLKLALFRHDGRIFASSNACRHQGGPLGEGRIVDGCITCPWHGWNYRVEDGISPPPFKEVIPTFSVRVADGRVFVNPTPLPAGTRCDGADVSAQRMVPDPTPFFIGYLAQAPAAVRQLSRTFAGGVALAAVGLMVVFALSQTEVDEGRFEFGRIRTFEGALYAEPVPTLRVADEEGERDYLLVGEGKHAIGDSLHTLDGKRVSLSGTLIERRETRMIEVSSATPPSVLGDSATTRPARIRAGTVALTGEIIDMKCFLGVMRPAVGKVHRGCAIRCLSGGVPPGFRVLTSSGKEMVFLLAGADGKRLELDPRFVGTAIELTADLEVQDSVPILRYRSARRL